MYNIAFDPLYIRKSLCRVVAKELNYNLELSEFKLQPRNNFDFKGLIPFGKVWTPYTTGFGLYITTTVQKEWLLH